ncbi:hypothetical protein INT43_008993 [Umbelopsis isabellina]|uniref:NADP-dependent oxidoreductase domain-containing protein n=1 Tax=Mortierella isabellina TaxID=91625 RepID=A0A8H7PX79_MORIS|nr:hypothetical protein INT43_008993 [Umbelopsis isabellina]
MSLLLTVPRREIGKTGVKISAIGYGAMSLISAPGVYGSIDDENSIKLLEKALKVGCNFWDTAGKLEAPLQRLIYVCLTCQSVTDVYGMGHSQKIISKVLKDHRKEVFLATKFAIDRFNTGKEKYLLENLAAGGVQLSKQELAEVREVAESFDVSGERYNPEMMSSLGD